MVYINCWAEISARASERNLNDKDTPGEGKPGADSPKTHARNPPHGKLNRLEKSSGSGFPPDDLLC